MTTLNVKAGPMLRYDNVDLTSGIYHAYAMIVTEDATSDYQLTPTLQYRWEDATSVSATNDGKTAVTENESHKQSEAIKLHQYHGKEGSFTFWRFKIEVPLADRELAVHYSIDGEAHPNSQSEAIKGMTGHTFFVPSKTDNFRWAGHSCNGFSASVDEKEFNGPNPLWDDLLKAHASKPYHAVIGGGDQIYCDTLVREPEMQEWNNQSDPKKRMKMPLTDEIRTCIDRYMFNHYCEWFGGGSFAKSIAQIPMINMLDDHDLIDGFGTYPDDLMRAPVFNYVGARGYFYFLLFQLFVNDEVDGVSETSHPNKSMIIGGDGVYIPFKNHSLLSYLGPKQWILLADCRSERKLDQICSKATYQRLFDAVRKLPPGVEHLIFLLGVPLAYPRMVFLERTLSSSMNPLIMLAKGLSPGFTNNFNGQVELLDDLGDHWCAGPHKHERNWLVERVQEVALEKHLRVSYISGDVHAAGVGVFYGYHQHDPSLDPKYSLAVITSAIVNTPPPPAVISMLNKLASKKHRSLFYCGTKETMVPLFETDLNDQKQKDKYIIGARNWCSVEYLTATGELEFDLRVEKVRGGGETKSYAVKAPAPKWDVAKQHHHLLLTKNFDKDVGTLRGTGKVGEPAKA
ncbi:plasma membrane protein [Pseudozyma hubeiensis SY62]|uniref:Plasma membrane protein n=1 Tax=Pseudozyma hubeiensis (strain SY62) TaxID=1305764 RepID=R9PAI7_PSEHS|nr:plasma membrane protein [Pseudozyma hubeiensis SY62]GAC98403.1 plasma membrane protein [Pseudozyma hubeiensis SY62]